MEEDNNFLKKCQADEAAYRYMGSSPCEDCEMRRHGRTDCEYPDTWEESLRCIDMKTWEDGYNTAYEKYLKDRHF